MPMQTSITEIYYNFGSGPKTALLCFNNLPVFEYQ